MKKILLVVSVLGILVAGGSALNYLAAENKSEDLAINIIGG